MFSVHEIGKDEGMEGVEKTPDAGFKGQNRIVKANQRSKSKVLDKVDMRRTGCTSMPKSGQKPVWSTSELRRHHYGGWTSDKRLEQERRSVCAIQRDYG